MPSDVRGMHVLDARGRAYSAGVAACVNCSVAMATIQASCIHLRPRGDMHQRRWPGASKQAKSPAVSGHQLLAAIGEGIHCIALHWADGQSAPLP